MLWYNIIISFHCIFIQHFQLQINYEKKMKKNPTPETFYDHGQYHKFHAFNSCMNDVSIGAKSLRGKFVSFIKATYRKSDCRDISFMFQSK